MAEHVGWGLGEEAEDVGDEAAGLGANFLLRRAKEVQEKDADVCQQGGEIAEGVGLAWPAGGKTDLLTN